MPAPRFRSWRATLFCGTALVPILGGAATAQIAADARPQGGQVVAGSASIAQDPALTSIRQSSDRAVVDWRSFNIGRDHTVRFEQPSASSMTLNRVTGPDPSVIAGRMTANGQLALVNQSGVLVTQGAQVQAQSVIISTADITNQAFMQGGGALRFDRPGQPGARVENQGSITVREAGLAALVAPQVANRGTIAARMGRVVLGGAETHAIDLHGDGLLALEVTGPVRRAPADGGPLVANTGSIEAAGGTVLLTAQAADGIVQDLVRAGGRISADSTGAAPAGRVLVAGTGGAVRIEGEVTARGLQAGASGGAIAVQGERLLVADGARLDASGRAGGGRITLGTDRRGPTAPRLARRSGIAPGATLRADATERGQGGEVLVNSSESTLHAGAISARGGPQGGDGGFVEVSGQRGLSVTGGIDVAAPRGLAGTILLDPIDLSIVAADDPRLNVDPALIADGFLGGAEGPSEAFLSADIVGGFAGNLLLQATQDLSVLSAVTKPSGGLSLFAGRNLTIDAPLVLGDPSAGIVLTLSGEQLAINALVQVPGTGRIDLLTPDFTGNNVVQSGAGRFVGGALTAGNESIPGSFDQVDLRGDNAVDGIGTFNAFDMQFRNTIPLTVLAGTTLRADTVGIDVTGGSLTVAGDIRAGGGPFAINLRSSGDIVVPAGGRVEGDGLRLIAGFDFATGAPNPEAAAALRLAGTVRGAFSDGGENDVELIAGRDGILLSSTDLLARDLSLVAGGDISQTGGRIVVSGLLRVSTPGNATLDVAPADALDGNLVSGIGPSQVDGDFSVTALSLEDSFALAGDIRVDGAFTLRSRGNGIRQLDASRLLVGALDMTSPADIVLEGDNAIAVVRQLVAEDGAVSLRNLTDLRIEGLVSATDGFVAVLVEGGGLDILGDVIGTDSVALRASGDITQFAGSTVQALGSVPAVRLEAGFDVAEEAPVLAGGLRLAGTLGHADGSNVLILGAGSGGIAQSAGRLVGQGLEVVSGGDAILDRGGDQTGPRNAISGGLPNITIPGDFVLDNGTTPILLQGAVIAAANIGLRTEGGLTIGPRTCVPLCAGVPFGLDAEAGRVSLRVGGLTVAPGAFIRGGLVEVAPALSGDLAALFPAPQAGAVNLDAPGFAAINATTLRLGATTFRGVTETTATAIRFGGPLALSGTLDLRSLGDVGQQPGASLAVTRLTGVAGGQVALQDGGNQVGILGDFSAGTGFALQAGSALALDGLLQTPGDIVLSAATTIRAEDTGRIEAARLEMTAEGEIALEGANRVASLGPVSASGLSFANAVGLQLVGSSVISGDVAFDITGALSQDSGATLQADALSGRATAGAVLEGGNRLASIDGFDAGSGDFALNNTAPLLTLTAGTEVTAAGRIGIVHDGALAVDATLRAAEIELGAAGELTLRGALEASGRVALVAEESIQEIGAGHIQAGLLTVQAGGTATLEGANRVASLGPVSASGLSFTNAMGLQLVGSSVISGDVTLDITGALSQALGATLQADALSGRATAGAVLEGGNRIRALAGFDAGSGDFLLANTAPLLTLRPGTEVTAAGRIGLVHEGALLVDATLRAAEIELGAAGELALRGALESPGRVALVAGEAIREAGAGRIQAAQLSLQAGGAVTLAGPNIVTRLGPVTAGGDVAFTNASGLVLAGIFDATGFELSLDITGALTQAPGAALQADALSGRATAGAVLEGPNQLARIEGFDAGSGDFRLANTAPLLALPSGRMLRAGGLLAITQAGDLLVDGTATGASTSLSASGGLTVNGFSAIARAGDLLLRGESVTVDGLIAAAGTIGVEAVSAANLGGIATAGLLRVTAPSVSFAGLDASATPVLLRLGADGTASGTLDARALEISGGAGASLAGSIAGITGEPAAAAGRRSAVDGTPQPDPPTPTAFLFNACPIGVPLCGAVPPVIPPVEGPEEPEVPVVPPVVEEPPPMAEPSLPAGAITVVESPVAVVGALDPSAIAASLVPTLPSAPTVIGSSARDRAEAEDLTPPNVRGGDF